MHDEVLNLIDELQEKKDGAPVDPSSEMPPKALLHVPYSESPLGVMTHGAYSGINSTEEERWRLVRDHQTQYRLHLIQSPGLNDFFAPEETSPDGSSSVCNQVLSPDRISHNQGLEAFEQAQKSDKFVDPPPQAQILALSPGEGADPDGPIEFDSETGVYTVPYVEVED